MSFEDARYNRFRELQDYVEWSDADAARLSALASRMEPHLPAVVDDFYEAITRCEATRKVITGGEAQIERLKTTLLKWVRELFSGQYDAGYATRRWRVGWRHVEIGLDQVYTNVALSRMRAALIAALERDWDGDETTLQQTSRSLNKLLDLDLAMIEDAYRVEQVERQQRNERLVTIGQVAGGVAHELRNPLNVIKTSVYFLQNARDPTLEKRTEHMRRVERQVELADGVITALSNFARMPIPDARPFSLAESLAAVLETTTLPARIVVSNEVRATCPRRIADEAQVRIVLANLIRNARDAMPQGGRLTITGRAVEGAVEVTVADKGVGIAPDLLARIIEPLFTTKARGLGLGLAISRSILDKNRGALSVVSVLNQGSAFTVRLPACPDGVDPR